MTYMTYQLDVQRNGAITNKEKQIDYCVRLYTKRFRKPPTEVIVGPNVITHNNLIIKSNEIYMVIDETDRTD